MAAVSLKDVRKEPRSRSEMIAETRAKLLLVAREAFGTIGYARASMDDFTAQAGLTRGALYHHFGSKKGLLEAVVAQLDTEMTDRLNHISASAANPWQGFVDECVAYIEMALEPEIQQIMHRDGPAVLGDPSKWPNQNNCIRALSQSITRLGEAGLIRKVDPEAAARVINGASMQAASWIANSDDPATVSEKAVQAFRVLLEGLLKDPLQGR